MENTMENQDSQPPQYDSLLLQRIADELAAIRDADERKNKTAKRQTLLNSIILGLILGYCVFNITQQGVRLREMESNQINIKQSLQIINAEIANELQRLDDLLNGGNPMDMQEPIIAEQVFLQGITDRINKHVQTPGISRLKNHRHF